jgi:aspartate carbamoyltransferase catalytic subunit
MPEPKIASWTRRHLLGLEELDRSELETILDRAEEFVEVSQRRRKKLANLKGKVVVNLFFEPSTRTRTSFGLAAKRLSADTIDFTTGGSSMSKGESFIDTAKNIEAMGIDVIVVRHSVPGAPHLLSQHLQCCIINAGDGAHEHPTQGLLDIFTIRRMKGRLEGLTVGLVGDISAGSGSLFPTQRHSAPLRRHQHASHSVRASAQRPVPLRPRICPPLWHGQ